MNPKSWQILIAYSRNNLFSTDCYLDFWEPGKLPDTTMVTILDIAMKHFSRTVPSCI